MTRDELKAKYCIDATIGETPVYEYRLRGGQDQKAYAVALEGQPIQAMNSVREFQIPKEYQKFFHATNAKPVKKLFAKASDAPKNWWRVLNRDKKVKNIIPPKMD